MAGNKSIDEYFFDFKNKSVDRLSKVYYVLGAFNVGYSPVMDEGVRFSSRQKGLVDLVKSMLSVDHATRHDGSYFFETSRAPILRSVLEKCGVTGDRKTRQYLGRSVPAAYAKDFLRGIFDSICYTYPDAKHRLMQLSQNNGFLTDMNNHLRELAGVKRKNPKGKQIKYHYQDAVMIYRFLYAGLDSIKANRIYLEDCRESMAKVAQYKRHPETASMQWRLISAKAFILEGHKITDVAYQLGYKDRGGLNNAFRRHYGRSITSCLSDMGVDYKKKSSSLKTALLEKLNAAKAHLSEGRTVTEAARLSGFSSQNHLANAFQRYFHKTPTEFKIQQEEAKRRRAIIFAPLPPIRVIRSGNFIR